MRSSEFINNSGGFTSIMKKILLAVLALSLASSSAFGATAAVAPMSLAKPGEAGFEEIPIDVEKEVGPYTVAAVYFQAVDMYPMGKNPSREDSDMHLEADIHLKKYEAMMYGFGSGDNIWPAYLTVKYQIMKGKDIVREGSFMPMNADDGPHYGANIAKGLPVGHYTLRFIIEPPSDYLLHTDAETGVPAKEGAKEFFKTWTVDFDWKYNAEQLAE